MTNAAMKPTRLMPEVPRSPRRYQTGVVLIVSLIVLIVMSLLAVFSVRNATSSESVASNVRTAELATQAAELALRHCEESIVKVVTVAAGGTSNYTTTFTAGHILPVESMSLWQSTTIWDGTSTAVFVVPPEMLNQSGLRSTYRRPPECMVAPIPIQVSGGTTTTAAFTITARGFGPEVAAADETRSRPVGTEVWLQSQIQLQ
jgi:Tfp pilus assembly protein PilX